MRALLAAAVSVVLGACSAGPSRFFSVSVLGPADARLAADAASWGAFVALDPPRGAVIVPAGARADGSAGDVVADAETLGVRVSGAVAAGATGVSLRLPAVEPGRDLSDYPEEWQAVRRVLRELSALRPVLERGSPALPPFTTPPGALLRAWSYGGRPYVVIVSGAEPLPFAPAALAGWRALFRVRADPRESLVPCGAGLCLPAGRALWLEGRPGL